MLMESVMKKISQKLIYATSLIALVTAGCGSNTSTVSGPGIYALSVTSVNPVSQVPITISPADLNSAGATGAPTPVTALSLIYNKGTAVTLTAPASTTSGPFVAWTGCDSTSGLVCNVTMTESKSVSVEFAGVTSIVITPAVVSVAAGSSVQLGTQVNGLGNCSYLPTYPSQPCAGSPVTYSVSLPSGANFSGFLGDVSSTGVYTTPYPAPPSVLVTATSDLSPSVSAEVTVNITSVAAASGPALTVDTGAPTHAISPDIYGMNDYQLSSSLPAMVNLPIERWGGDATTRYNYSVDADNSAADYYFENSFPSTTGYPKVSQFDSQVTQDELTNTKTIATVPLIGYTSQRISACSYSVAKYGAQTVVDPNRTDCGTGILVTPVNGSTTIKNDPTDTSVAIDQSFDNGWVNFLVGQYGTAAKGGVAIYSLDNEPEYWSGVHKDVHPNPFTYDELTNKGLAYAAAIKSADPTAEVTGPVISNWLGYFYSAQDIADGYAHSPSCPNANPLDRLAHGNTPLIDYYLQQFAAYDKANSQRLLDYVDLHTYFAAPGAAFATAGDTTLQAARLNSTRVFWDSTYTDPNYTDPNNTTCTGAAYPPNLINLEKSWVANDYPGTKLAISEYNWGGLESVNGAVAQADILGIFGREGLDVGTLWGAPSPTTQLPGVIAFQMYTNYDGNNAHFGDMAVSSTSANQGQLSVYGATRTSDGATTIMVINKTFGTLTSTLSLPSTKAGAVAASYLYSNGNPAMIVTQSPVTVAAAGTGGSIAGSFPAQSITLFVIPK